MKLENISHIIDSMINGQFKQAKEQTLKGVKTKPEKLARRVGQVVGALMDKDGFHNNPHLATAYLKLFGNDDE